MPQRITIQEYWTKHQNRGLLDVRTPAEYKKGHIPGALNLPLFSDEERVVVGTIYKQTSPDEAFLKGLEFAGARMRGYVEQALQLAPEKKIVMHCWRGGKRSQSLAWLLEFAGFEILLLEKGYKKYRNYIHKQFEEIPIKLIVIGGRTGCGKSKVLHALKDQGEQIIDLEGLAHHKGSAFGWIGEQDQPQVEQFENDLYQALQILDLNKPVWIENESKSIGRVYIPHEFWKLMKAAPLINIDIPLERRVEQLVEDYAQTSVDELILSFEKIKKRIGGQHLNAAIEALQANDLKTATTIALHYYDKAYQYNLDNNLSPSIHKMKFEVESAAEIASILLTYRKENLYNPSLI